MTQDTDDEHERPPPPRHMSAELIVALSVSNSDAETQEVIELALRTQYDAVIKIIRQLAPYAGSPERIEAMQNLASILDQRVTLVPWLRQTARGTFSRQVDALRERMADETQT